MTWRTTTVWNTRKEAQEAIRRARAVNTDLDRRVVTRYLVQVRRKK